MGSLIVAVPGGAWILPTGVAGLESPMERGSQPGAAKYRNCHREEPIGRRGDLGSVAQSESTRLLRYARNDKLGPVDLSLIATLA